MSIVLLSGIRVKFTQFPVLFKKIIKELGEADEDRLDQWDDLRSAYERFVDPEVLDGYDIKKFSWKQFYDVIADMESAGQSYSQIMLELDDDALHDALINKYPKLEK